MADRKPLDELDLLALADGLLDQDPVRKAEIEAMLENAPASRERVRAFKVQTRALRAAYAGRLDEPVPERLRAVLERRPGWWGRAGLRAAAALLLVALAGLGGWAIGQGDDPEGWSVSTLIDQSYAQYAATGAGEPPFAAVGTAVTEARPLGWLAEEVSIKLKTPDLSSEGYALVGKQAVAIGGDQIVRLDYVSPEGESFSLFIAPRWESRPAEIAQAERGGVSLSYWFDGPLASAVVTRIPAADARALAEAVRRAMHAETTAPTLLEPDFAPGYGRDGVLADKADPNDRTPPQRPGAADGALVKHN